MERLLRIYAILGRSLTILGTIASIIAIWEAISLSRGYMSDNSINAMLVVLTIFEFIVMILFAHRSISLWTSAKQEVSDLVDLIYDLSEYPHKNGRAFDRQLNIGLRAAIAKSGKIPRDTRALITRLNEKDLTFGARFKEIENDLKENGLI